MNVYQLYHCVSWFDFGRVTEKTMEYVHSQAEVFEKLLAAGWRIRYNEHASEGEVYYDIFGKFATTEEAYASLKECGLDEYDVEELETMIVKRGVE